MLGGTMRTAMPIDIAPVSAAVLFETFHRVGVGTKVQVHRRRAEVAVVRWIGGGFRNVFGAGDRV